jgi:hypothetical protein
VPRPDGLEDLKHTTTTETKTDRPRQSADKTGLGAQFKREVNSAAKQIRRDFRSLFN